MWRAEYTAKNIVYLLLAITILICISEHSFSMLENLFIQDESRDDKTFLNVGRTSEAFAGHWKFVHLYVFLFYFFYIYLFFNSNSLN